jgi:hypothetical protein
MGETDIVIASSRLVACLCLVAIPAAVARCGSGNTGAGAPGGPDAASPGNGADATANADAGTDGAVADGTSLDASAARDGSDATVHADSGASADAGGEASSCDAGSGDAGGLGQGGNCLDGGYAGCAVVLASGQDTPRDIAVDSVNVYWCNSGTRGSTNGSIMKVHLEGGTPVTLASGQDFPEFLVVYGSSVYWSNVGLGGAGSVMSVPTAGGTPITVGTSTLPQDLTVDGTYVYWADQSDGAIYRAPIGGGNRTTFATAPTALGVAVDSTHVYWTEVNAGYVMGKPFDGGTATTIASGQDTPWEVVVDGTYAYWRNLGFNTSNAGFGMAPLAGGGTPIVIRGNNGSGDLALDGKNLYFATPSSVYSIPVPLTVPDGAVSSRDLTALQQNPEGLAVDSTSLYWTVMSDGTILKMTPK